MKYLYLFLFIFYYQSSLSQTLKAYISSDGCFIDGPKKASSYILVQKLEDSVYDIKQYSLDNKIIMKGYYKDKELNIPNGKFFYYQKNIDSNFVKQQGYYLNGQKAGYWISYRQQGVKNYICTYENGKLNGPYQQYNSVYSNYLYTEGYYINDKREGEWTVYDTSKNIIAKRTYLHDTLINTIIKTRNVVAPDNFISHIERIPAEYRQGLIVSFLVDTDGSLKDFHFNHNINQKRTQAIISVILSSGKFQAAINNERPVKCIYSFSLTTAKDAWENSQEEKAFDIIGRNTDKIGRGLNRAGIGKPLN